MASNHQIKDIANALIDSVQDTGEINGVVSDLKLVIKVFEQSPDSLRDLREKAVQLSKRQSALKAALSAHVHEHVLNALLILQYKDLLDELPTFVTAVVAAAQEKTKQYQAKVKTAIPLNETEIIELKRILSAKFGELSGVEEIVDSKILGGLIVDIGDWHFDASVKGKIERLKQELMS
ncbi:MAG: ATP synthase F1 subunit delta [Patescibacteria group bacterium]